MLKNIIIILSVILNLVFIPAFIVDYTAQEEEENLFNTHFVWNDDEESIPQEGSSVIIEEISSDTI
jgi:type IV secretory pathway VirB3-like protein